MALSNNSDLHIDGTLQNVAVNYRPQNFIADMVCPIVPVQKKSDGYPVFSRFETFALEDAERAPNAQAKKIQRSVGSYQFNCRNYALGYDTPIEDSANMDAALRYELESNATRYLIGKLQLAKEKRVITLAVASANVGSVCVVSSAWGATAGANGSINAGDPIAAIEVAKEFVRSTTGQKPNSIWFGYKAWLNFRRNGHVRNLVKGSNNGGGFMTRQQAQEIVEMDRFLISEALWHARNEAYGVGSMTATMSLSNPMDHQVILYYAPPSPSRDDPSWMYGFDWRGSGLPDRYGVIRHPHNSREHNDGIEVMEYVDERVTGADYAIRIITNAASGAAGIDQQ